MGGSRSENSVAASHPYRLSEYPEGANGSIMKVGGDHEFRLRMIEMGLTEGIEIKVVKYAPLSDPIECLVKGYHLSLRREQAAKILMNPPEKES